MRNRVLMMAMAVAVLAAGDAAAVERVLSLTPENTEITFNLEATGEDVLGHLALSEGEIHFDTDTGEAFGRVAIDARNSETGNKKRDKKMHSKVLETDQFPLIQFTPESIEGPVAGRGESDPILHGTVRILGHDHPLDLPAHVEVDGENLRFETRFEVPYVDWGMHNPSFLVLRVAKTVNVSIVAEGKLVGGSVDEQPAGSR